MFDLDNVFIGRNIASKLFVSFATVCKTISLITFMCFPLLFTTIWIQKRIWNNFPYTYLGMFLGILYENKCY